MIEEILTASGIQYRESFMRLPANTCAVYFDETEIEAPDQVTPPAEGLPCIVHHDVRVELYALKADPESEKALEAAIRARGLTYKKYGREWVQAAQRYLTTYELTYTSKN